jgi:hypothetical protein
MIRSTNAGNAGARDNDVEMFGADSRRAIDFCLNVHPVYPFLVMAGLVPAIHAFLAVTS